MRMRKQLKNKDSSTFIACMLTIVGYSINATIVIFDRVREELKEEKLRIESMGSRRKKKRKGEEVNPDTLLDP